MVKKFTLTVNDHEYELINKWKADFNLSSIFRDAVLEKISVKERIENETATAIDFFKLIERLQKEKNENNEYIFTIAVKDATKWVSTAKYQDLIYLETWKPPYDGTEINTKKLITDPTLGSYFKQIIQRNSEMAASLNSKYLNNCAKTWFNIWSQSVSQCWKDIKAKL
ncbi:MAG: hypothetical protein AAGU21_15680 [Solidesulfovibrio sp.]|uniref:hypothetical protein n=1 Tax=Solidesulfovibrio sp. TaxID=2910990 RepID=UPI00315954C4